MTMSQLGVKLDSEIHARVLAAHGEPIEIDGECDNCLAKPLPVWPSLNIDGDWIALCARCVEATR